MNVGIVGCGVIGTALKKWIENNTSHNIFVLDPYKGFNDDLSKSDIIFIQIHIPTEENGTQNLSTLEEIIKELPDKPIFIRTTILPGTSDKLSKKFNKRIYFMPEFLTERTSHRDFEEQPMVFTGETALLKSIFLNKSYIEMSNIDAEITKYAHNVFGALKVTYFNGIYELCQNLGGNFNNVHTGILLSGYINDCHTKVPGPDGLFGYGGKCFPKDVNAFAEFLKDSEFGSLINIVKNLNNIYRK